MNWAARLRDKDAPHIVVFRSTLVPGTVEEVLRPIVERESGKKDGVDFHVCFQPEFLREGSSIRDYDNPPFTIVGANAEAPRDEASSSVRKSAVRIPSPPQIRAAEMVKYCCNNFHALKITFANETARLCEALGVDPFEVMDLVCKDRQLNISPAYLKPGFAFGGSCLPKDLRATLHLAKMRDVELPMLGGIMASNRHHIDHAIDKIMASGKRRIGHDRPVVQDGHRRPARKPAGAACRALASARVFPLWSTIRRCTCPTCSARTAVSSSSTCPHIGSLLRGDIAAVVTESDVLVVGSSDARVAAKLVEHARADQVVIDLVRLTGRERLRAQYQGLCW